MVQISELLIRIAIPYTVLFPYYFMWFGLWYGQYAELFVARSVQLRYIHR